MGRNGNWYDYRFAANKYASYNTWHKYSAIKYSDVCLLRYSFFTRCWRLASGYRKVERRSRILSIIFSRIYLSNAYVSVELAGILSSIVTITFGFLIIKLKGKSGQNLITEHAAATEREVSIIKIISPYIFLTVCILLSPRSCIT